MEKNKLFREKYAIMEGKIRKKFKIHEGNSLYFVFNEPGYKKFAETFDQLANIRNLFSHTNMENYITVNDESINSINAIIKFIDSPPKVIENCVLIKDILSATYEDNVLDKIKIIKEKKFNSIPIINNQKLIGLFTENTISDKIISEEIIEVNKNTTFLDFKDYLILDEDKVAFIPKNMNIFDLYKLHKKNFNSKKFTEFYFITSNGKKDDKLIGMITSQRIATLSI